MKKEYLRKLNKNNGITLIVLVITIIVLLLLAGISVVMLIGEGGILEQATTAKNETNISMKNEIDKTNLLSKQINYPNLITAIKLKDLLKGDQSLIGETVELETSSELVEKYEWQIFYADSNNIYLIAKDYINYNDMPTGRNGVKVNCLDGTQYRVRFSDLVNATNENSYIGSIDVKDPMMQELNSDYFITKGYESTNANMKVMAYLLDKNIWMKKFIENEQNNNKIEYVIGAPSIELIFKSYNAKYGTNYEAIADSKNGYKIRKTKDDELSNSIDSILMKKNR